MNNTISIIIIGYNSKKNLESLLQSINQLIIQDNKIEVIYIDDGSSDNSLDYFINYKLIFSKKYYGFDKNKGRVYASQKGIELASGDWLLMLQSNVIVNNNLIIEYNKSINNDNILAIVGNICYQSHDKIFMNYLNNKNRGINKYKNIQPIHYRYLLFGNSLIKRHIFNHINLNLNLKFYGGEELDFAFKLNNKFPNSIINCNSATVTRINFPSYKNHLKRLQEYGKYNLELLNPILQKEVIKWPMLIHNNNKLLKLSYQLIFLLCQLFYRIPVINFYVIRLGMLMAIIKGYHSKSTK